MNLGTSVVGAICILDLTFKHLVDDVGVLL